MTSDLRLGPFLFFALVALAPGPTLAQVRLEAPGGVAAQSITNSPINIYNRDPEEIKRLAEQLDRSEGNRQAAEAKAAELARHLDLSNVTTQTVIGFLRILARQPDLKLDQVPAKMAEITASYIRMQERLGALSPEDPTAADLARRAADAAKAGHFDEADRLLDQAEARETAAIDEHRKKVAEIRVARGDNAATQLHHVEAARYYEAAAEELPPSAAQEKGFYLFLAGDELVISGNLTGAFKDFETSHAIRDRLAKADPGNAGWQRDLSVSYTKIGDVQVAQGNLPEALKSFHDGLAILDRLAKADPGNAGWQHDLSVSYAKLASVFRNLGEATQALAVLRQGRAILVRLTTLSQDNQRWRNELAWFNRQIAELQR
jgi:hypothetical protein